MKQWLLLLSVLILVAGCDGSAPATPTPTPPQAAGPTPTPVSTFDLTPFVGVWNLTLRLTDVKTPGTGGCVATTMQSQIGAPRQYSLTITKNQMVIATASGDYACTFSNFRTDSNSFTTEGVTGYYTCKGEPLDYRCDDGSVYGLITFGQDISGSVSGAQMTGTWEIAWATRSETFAVEATANFTGSRR